MEAGSEFQSVLWSHRDKRISEWSGPAIFEFDRVGVLGIGETRATQITDFNFFFIQDEYVSILYVVPRYYRDPTSSRAKLRTCHCVILEDMLYDGYVESKHLGTKLDMEPSWPWRGYTPVLSSS